MAMINFDASTVETPSFDPIPSGIYEAVITDSQMQPNKAGTGEMLKLTFEIIAGEYTGRKLWENLNISHQNPKAVEVARQNLARICCAVGVMRLSDSCELHNLPMLINVRTTKTDDDVRSDIKDYRPSPPPEAYVRPTTVPPKPVATTTSPWAKPNQ